MLQDIIDKLRDLLKIETDKVGRWKLAVIAKDDTVSGAVDLGGNFAYLQVEVPTIDSAQLELQVNDIEGGTYQDLGQDALTTAGTGAFSDTWNLAGWQFVKIKASAAQTTGAVNFKIRGITY